MFIVVLKILHITVAVFLILVVLLQTGKGAEMGAAFGGASQTVFGSSGPAGFMARLTTTAAVVFMLTSLSLAYVSATGRSIGDITPEAPAPIEAPLEVPMENSGDATLADTGQAAEAQAGTNP